MGKRVCFSIDVDCSVGDRVSQKSALISLEDNYIRTGVEIALPRYLELMEEWKAKTTIFIISETIKTETHRAILREAVGLGHEIACHSATHPKDLGLRSSEYISNELSSAKSKLEDIIGEPVIGFRAPGYYLSQAMINQLYANGYKYSSSINSSLIYNVIKLIFALKSRISGARDYAIEPKFMFAPSAPYFPKMTQYWTRSLSQTEDCFVEIPVSNDPFRLIPAVMFAIDTIVPDLVKKVYTRFLFSSEFINFVFHDLEFLSQDDFSSIPIPFAQKLSSNKKEMRDIIFSDIKGHLADSSMVPLREVALRLFETENGN